MLVFETPTVRKALQRDGAGADALRWEYARNDSAMGVPTKGVKPESDRFFGQSKWYGAPGSRQVERQRPRRKSDRYAHSSN